MQQGDCDNNVIKWIAARTSTFLNRTTLPLPFYVHFFVDFVNGFVHRHYDLAELRKSNWIISKTLSRFFDINNVVELIQFDFLNPANPMFIISIQWHSHDADQKCKHNARYPAL
jgi:hypothetical protein